MNRSKVILAVWVIFMAGVVTGGLTVRLRHRPVPRPAVSVAPPWVNQRVEFLRRVQKEIDLTSDQRQKMERILRESHERVRAVWDRVAPETRDEFRRVREEIHLVLTPTQWDKFQALSKQRPPRELPDGRVRAPAGRGRDKGDREEDAQPTNQLAPATVDRPSSPAAPPTGGSPRP